MTIIVKTSTGIEKAIDLSVGGWEAVPIENDMSKIKLILNDSEDSGGIFIEIHEYNKIKEKLDLLEEVIDLTK